MAATGTTPENAAAKWQRRLAAAGPDIIAGVNNVTRSPGQAAADQMQVWLQNTTSAAQRWADSLRAMSLQDWQQSMINKGVNRITSGAAAGQGKVQAFMSQWLPFQQQVVASLPPRGNLEQNIQRAAAVARANAEAKGRFRQRGRSR